MKKKNLNNEPGFHGPTFVQFTCPNCGKRRLYRPQGYRPSDKMEWSADKKKQRYIDVCDFCYKKYATEDSKYFAENIDKAREAIEKGENMPEGVSIEDGLIDDTKS